PFRFGCPAQIKHDLTLATRKAKGFARPHDHRLTCHDSPAFPPFRLIFHRVHERLARHAEAASDLRGRVSPRASQNGQDDYYFFFLEWRRITVVPWRRGP